MFPTYCLSELRERLLVFQSENKESKEDTAAVNDGELAKFCPVGPEREDNHKRIDAAETAGPQNRAHVNLRMVTRKYHLLMYPSWVCDDECTDTTTVVDPCRTDSLNLASFRS